MTIRRPIPGPCATERAARGERSTRSTLLGIAFFASLMTLAMAPTAHAGTYVIDSCPSAPGGSENAGPWTVFGSPQDPKGSCSGGIGNWIGPLGGTMGPSTLDGVQVTTPAGITIHEAKVWWYVPHQTSGAETYAIASVNNGVVEESNTPKNSTNTPDDFVLPSSTTELTLADYCSNSPGGCNFGGGGSPDLEFLGGQLTLADSILPTGTVTGGSLTGTAKLSGTASLSYDAQDDTSGVRLVQLRIDGVPAAQNDYAASCAYSDFLACPPSESSTITWNTASVTDGQHSLELIVEDAAQNTSVIYDATITTQNTPAEKSPLGAPPGPGTSTATSTSTSTGSTTAGTTTQTAGAPNGTNASESAQLQLGIPRTITRTYTHSALNLAGRLLDPQGHPIGNATLDVLQQTAGTTALNPIAQTTTRPDGTFTVRVPAGPSRLIEIAYRAFPTDTSYSAQAGIEESVNADVQLHITPRRTSPGGTITLTGTVQGPIPARGAIVELLVHYRGRWEPFRTPRTNSHGHFHVEYQFEGATGHFPFYAEVPAGQAGFPYASGHSQVIDVTTR
jgi:hypothetical protein